MEGQDFDVSSKMDIERDRERTRRADRTDERKVLLVANPYPPMVSAGTTRVVRFVRHLPGYGWTPSVLAPRTAGETTQPDDVQVIRTPVPMPRRLLGGGPRSTRVNRWISVPDPYAMWVPPAVREGHRLLQDESFEAIFSSSPRPSVHLVAAMLARLSGLPWVADYRDPWATYQFRTYPTRAHSDAHRRLEARAMRHVSVVTAVNQPIIDDLVQRHPWLGDRVAVLPNGYDPSEPLEDVTLGPGFWIVHTGRLYGREQQVSRFLAALGGLPADVRALFIGVDESRVLPEARRLGVGSRVRVEPFVPHRRALGYQRAADALLLVNGRRPESMSSKVFEYLAADRPIFAISPAGSAGRMLFREVGGGTCVLPDDDMALPLADFVRTVRGGTAPAADGVALQRYDMTHITAQLAALLQRIADGSPAVALRRARAIAGGDGRMRT